MKVAYNSIVNIVYAILIKFILYEQNLPYINAELPISKTKLSEMCRKIEDPFQHNLMFYDIISIPLAVMICKQIKTQLVHLTEKRKLNCCVTLNGMNFRPRIYWWPIKVNTIIINYKMHTSNLIPKACPPFVCATFQLLFTTMNWLQQCPIFIKREANKTNAEGMAYLQQVAYFVGVKQSKSLVRMDKVVRKQPMLQKKEACMSMKSVRIIIMSHPTNKNSDGLDAFISKQLITAIIIYSQICLPLKSYGVARNPIVNIGKANNDEHITFITPLSSSQFA